jgi:hypothetical protein
MVCFQTENPSLGKFRRALDWKMFIHVMAIWNIYGDLGYFMTIWYILVHFFRFRYHCSIKIWQPRSRVLKSPAFIFSFSPPTIFFSLALFLHLRLFPRVTLSSCVYTGAITAKRFQRRQCDFECVFGFV